MGILMRNGINYSGSQLPSVTIEDSGKILTVNNNGAWSAQEVPTDEQVSEAVDEWLTNHPEATTTVQDNSLTWVKFNDVLKNMMFKLGITDSKSGEVVSTSDAAEFPLKDLQAEITATQNLNGYDYPWVGGAGKNKLNITATTQTINGVTFTINSDGTISLSGTASNTTILDVATFSAVGGTAYKLSGCPSGGSTSKYLLSIPAVGYDSGSGYNYTPSTSADVAVRITIYSGQNTQGLVFKPMICLASAPNPDYAHFEPYENICPISGRTEVNVTRTGKNLVNIDDIEIGKAWNGAVTNARATIFFTIKPNTQYTFSINNIDNFDGVYWAEKTTKGDTTAQRLTGPLSLSYTITTTANTNIGVIQFNKANISASDFDNIKIQVELGSTATAYEPYEGDTFNTELGRTVYGGMLDLTTGELTITHAYVDLGDFTWTVANLNIFQTQISEKKQGSTNFITTSYRTVVGGYANLANGEATSISPMTHGHIYTYVGIKDERATTAEEFTTLVTGQKMVYELATPTTISLTPTEVMMLENNNTIWADSGDVAVSYLVDAKTYIDNQ